MWKLFPPAIADFICFTIPATSPNSISRSLLQPIVVLIAMGLVGNASGQRDLKVIPDPDPELERQTFIVADGFEVNLFAADPQMAKPIQMNFDHDGRLWIASSEVYPHIKPGQEATDKILVLEDSDRDGTADQTTVFADDLLIPTGVVPGDGGVYVANSTELIHLSDQDGDGKADRRRIVLSGFGTEDTHHLLHTLRWGPDGCLYMNQSIYIHSHVETPYGVKRLNGGGIWRFQPERLQLEVLCHGFVNPWGHHFDRWGQSFATDGAYREGINYVFPGSVFFTAVGATRIMAGLNPGSPKHCGLEILSGRHLPESWQGNMITNDFRAHRVCRFVVSEDGSGYASRQETELIKSTHVAFRPIDVKVGPDGAIYIADWYNPIIQHGEVDFRDPRRDHVHGRIWRVTAKDRDLLEVLRLSEFSTEQLLELLTQPESWRRLHAKLLLKQRPRQETVAAVDRWIAGLDSDHPDFEQHRLEAMWAYQCLDRANLELIQELQQSPDHRVRAAAVRAASHAIEQLPNASLLFQTAISDQHPRVRLEGVRAIAKIPAAESASAVLKVLDQPLDRFLDFAAWKSLRDLQPQWLPAFQRGEFDYGGNTSHLTFALEAVDSPDVATPLLQMAARQELAADERLNLLRLVASIGNPDNLRAVLTQAVDQPEWLSDSARVELLTALSTAARERNVKPGGDLSSLGKLISADDLATSQAAIKLAGVWRVGKLRDQLSRIAKNAEADTGSRLIALGSLGGFRQPQVRQLLAEFADSDADLQLREAAVSSLATVDAAEAARQVIGLLESLPAERSLQPLLGSLLARKDGAQKLTAALEGKAMASEVAKRVLRAAQGSGQSSPELLNAIRAAGRLDQAKWQLTPELVSSLLEEIGQRGDAARGELVYRRGELQCTKCHAIGGAGGVVGPDLLSVGASAQPDYLIESLLAPNAKVKENFHSIIVLTDEGKIISGIPIRSSDRELVLRNAEDQLITLAKDTIEEEKEGRSLMPEGTVDGLTRGELVDLVRFLSELGKVGRFAVSKERVARRWETLAWSPDANRRLNRTSFDLAATGDPTFNWLPAYSLVSGSLPTETLPQFKPHRETPQTTFVRSQLNVTTAGPLRLQFNSLTGLEFWLDGKPTPLETTLSVTLAKGLHTLTFAVDRESRQEPLRVELLDGEGETAQAQWVSGK